MKKAIFAFVCCLVFAFAFGQTQKKTSTIFYKLDITEVTLGKYLDKAREFSIEDFVIYYVEKGDTSYSKKYGTEIIAPVYKDAVFTYFGRKHNSSLLDFFKVKTSDLERMNLGNIDGAEIRKNFIEKIVPESDKQKVAKNEKMCSMGNYTGVYTYNYKKETKEILIKYKWRISCEFLFNIINKTYVALYNIETKTFKVIK